MPPPYYFPALGNLRLRLLYSVGGGERVLARLGSISTTLSLMWRIMVLTAQWTTPVREPRKIENETGKSLEASELV
jgi:hypothetical protein